MYERIARILRDDEPDVALVFFQKAIQVFNDINERRRVASCEKIMGDIYRARGDYDRAILYHDKAAAFYVGKISEKFDASIAKYAPQRLMDLCIDYRTKGDFQTAITYGNRSIDLILSFPDSFSQRDRLVGRAMIFQAESHLDAKQGRVGVNYADTPWS